MIEGFKKMQPGFGLKALAVVLFFVFASSPAFSQGNLVFGSKVQSPDLDLSRALSPFCAAPKFAFIDLNDDGLPEANEPIYVHITHTFLVAFRVEKLQVGKDDVRLTPFDGYPAGSQVAEADPDYGKDLLILGTLFCPIQAELRYLDADGDGAYSLPDPVYLQFDPAPIRSGDVRITGYLGYEAGSRVLASQADSGKLTTTLPGTFSFFNANGNINNRGEAVFDGGDVIYVDTKPFGSVSVNDIRLSI